jgi:uncharacterized coiled-coil protein SlyX
MFNKKRIEKLEARLCDVESAWDELLDTYNSLHKSLDLLMDRLNLEFHYLPAERIIRPKTQGKDDVEKALKNLENLTARVRNKKK